MVLEYVSIAAGILAAGFFFNSLRWWDWLSKEAELPRTARLIALVTMCLAAVGSSDIFGHPRSIQAVGIAALVICVPQLVISWVWLVMLPPDRRKRQ